MIFFFNSALLCVLKILLSPRGFSLCKSGHWALLFLQQTEGRWHILQYRGGEMCLTVKVTESTAFYMVSRLPGVVSLIKGTIISLLLEKLFNDWPSVRRLLVFIG